MTTLFTALALAVAAYRIRKGMFTRAEWVVLAVWGAHFVVELALMYVDHMFFRYEARFFRPADFLTWFWLAWGVGELLKRYHKAKAAVFALLGLIVIYDLVLVSRANLPVGRRNAYAAACEWAAEQIKADWKGPARDDEFVFLLGEYRTPLRPVVDCHSARVAYLVGGRSNGADDGVDAGTDTSERIKRLDAPDYWIQDLRNDDPPKGDDWRLMGVFKRGKYELPLYKRVRKE